MSLEDREALLEEMRGRLREIVPAAMMDRILKTASESMAKFDIVQLTEEETRKDDLLQYYLGAMRVQGRSQKTIDLYAYTIGRMLADVKVPAAKVTIHHLRSWIAKEQARGISGTTLNGDRQIFCAFFNWLQRESLIEKNPVANLGAIKCARKKREAYSETDTEKLKRACDNTRDLALINFLESTGCRISEALGLDREDVNMERGECVVHGKGDKERRVYMDAVTVMTIKEYLDGRKDEEQALGVLMSDLNSADNPLDEVQQKESYEILMPLMEQEGKPFLSMSDEVWQATMDWMLESGLISEECELSELYVMPDEEILK